MTDNERFDQVEAELLTAKNALTHALMLLVAQYGETYERYYALTQHCRDGTEALHAELKRKRESR